MIRPLEGRLTSHIPRQLISFVMSGRIGLNLGCSSQSLSALRGRGEVNSSAFITLQPKPRGESGEKGVRLDESTTFQHRCESGWLFVHVASPTNMIWSCGGSSVGPATLCYSLLRGIITADQRWCMRMMHRQEKLFHPLINNSCRRKQILCSCWGPLLCGKWFDACAPSSVDIFGDGFFVMLIVKTSCIGRNLTVVVTPASLSTDVNSADCTFDWSFSRWIWVNSDFFYPNLI